MKWTGRGVLSVEGKSVEGKKSKLLDIYPGDNIPSGALDTERIKKFKEKGLIDGKLTGQQYEEHLKKVEENQAKAGGKESASKTKVKKEPKKRTKKQLQTRAKELNKRMTKLKVGKDDAEIEEIEVELSELEKQFEGAE